MFIETEATPNPAILKFNSGRMVGGNRTYQPSRILAFADDVPVGQGRGPIDGKPAAYVCRNRTCEAPLTSAEALRERCST